MWNISLSSTYCAIKLVFVVVPSIIAEIVFVVSWECHNWLQVQQHQFAQVKEATSKIIEPGLCPYKVFINRNYFDSRKSQCKRYKNGNLRNSSIHVNWLGTSDPLRNLVAFVQFKKTWKKHPWKSVTFTVTFSITLHIF